MPYKTSSASFDNFWSAVVHGTGCVLVDVDTYVALRLTCWLSCAACR